MIDRIGELNVEGIITTRKFREEFYRNPNLPLLIGDDVFVRGIDRGIEEGVFVYKKGDLIRGPGSPHSDIIIDDDSIIFTMEKAKEAGRWPPQDNNTKGPKDGREHDGTYESKTDDKGEFDKTDESEETFRTEGKPYEAITELWKKIRGHKISKITEIEIESKDDVFPLLSALNKIKKINVKTNIEGDYNVGAAGTFGFEYEGALDGTEEEREFLKNRLQNADVLNIKVTLTITFREEVGVDWLNELASILKWVENSIKISNIDRP